MTLLVFQMISGSHVMITEEDVRAARQKDGWGSEKIDDYCKQLEAEKSHSDQLQRSLDKAYELQAAIWDK